MRSSTKQGIHAKPSLHSSLNRFLGRKKSAYTSTPFLITQAQASPLENWHRRRKVYSWLQFSRLPIILLGVVVLFTTNLTPLAIAILLLSVPLPWIAVLLANSPGEKAHKGAQKVYKPAAIRESSSYSNVPDTSTPALDSEIITIIEERPIQD